MAATLEEVSQELKENNDVMVDVRENTDLSANYLGSVVDIFSTKLDELVGFMRGNQLDELERRREEGQDGGIEEVKQDDYVEDFLKKVSEFSEQLLRIIGTAVGIIAAPFVLIGTFFKELGAQVAALDRLLKGGLSRFFSPITRLFNAIRESRAVQSVLGLWRNTVVPFFARIGEFLGLVEKGDDGIRRATGFFAKIVNTAARLGTFLARLNPIILGLVGAFQFVTGFAEGFKRDGVIEGLKQGIVDTFDAIFGSLIRLVTDIPAFLFKLIGLNDFGSALSNLGSTVVDSIITTFESAVDLIVGLFTFDANKIKNASVAGGDAVINVISSFINLGYGLIKDLFSFIGIDLPEIDFGKFIRDTITNAENWIKKQLGFDGETMPSITDIFMNIITAPVDLLRSAKDWLLSKFGFDPETVPDPTDIVMDIVKAPFRLLEDLRDWISERVGGLVSKFASFIPDPIKSLLGLDKEESDGDNKDSKGIVGSTADTAAGVAKGVAGSVAGTASGVAKGVGGFVSGIFSGDDEEEVSSGSSPARVVTGDELQMEGEARRNAELEMSQRIGGPGSNAVNVATNVQNNSNTTTQTRPPAASQPDNMSDTMLTAGFAP